MHILISPNAFKNSLDAFEAARAIEEGIRQSRPAFTTTIFPVGDGGDGTGRLLTHLCGGNMVKAETVDPLNKKIEASFGLINKGNTAVIEMAAASGLHLMGKDELSPMRASSYGTGLQLRQALDLGVKKILLCVGGSATVDGGTGLLSALGFRFLDKDGAVLNELPAQLDQLSGIDRSLTDERIFSVELTILCDVKNTLLGNKGAAAVFGPQKGASPVQVEELEKGLNRLNAVVLEQTGLDMSQLLYGGAAGGVAAGLHALLHAQLVNGIDHFLDTTGFDEALAKADMLITGEGSIDLQTLEGKAPYGVAIRAKEKNIPVIAMAGKIPAQNHPELDACFDELICINEKQVDTGAALAATYTNLVKTSASFIRRY